VDFDFLRKVKFSFIEKLEKLDFIGLFDASDKVILNWLDYVANFEKVEPQGKGRTYYTTKVKSFTIMVTIPCIEKIFNLNPNPSKLSTLNAFKQVSIDLPFKICSSHQNQEHNSYFDPQILYYIKVRTI